MQTASSPGGGLFLLWVAWILTPDGGSTPDGWLVSLVVLLSLFLGGISGNAALARRRHPALPGEQRLAE